MLQLENVFIFSVEEQKSRKEHSKASVEMLALLQFNKVRPLHQNWLVWFSVKVARSLK